MLDIYIRTRGLRTDYSFLLEEQRRIPDLNDYKSDIEKPTCILERTEENGCSLFLSGIPSQRKDHQGTPIRYDLVAIIDDPLNGNWNNDYNHENYVMGLTGLIWIWLNDVRNALREIQEDGKRIELVRSPTARKSELGRLLDQTLPEEDVEELLQLTKNHSWTEDKKSELDNKLKDLILQIPRPSALTEQKLALQSWWGGANNDLSCNQWIELVEKILKGETQGKALLLNIATPQSLGRLSVKNEELGVLLAKEWSQLKPKPIELQDSQENNLGVIDWIKKRAEEDSEIVKKKFQQVVVGHFFPGKDSD